MSFRGMATFVAALVLFLLCHLVPAAPPVRAALTKRLGRPAYLVIYSVLSLALFAWLVVAAREAPTIWLWEPRPWQWFVPLLAMPFAAVLLVAGVVWPNPLSLSLRAGSDPGPVVRITRHPLLWALLLWAMSHIPPNGTVVAVILFGSMALLSVFGFASLDRKARARLGPDRWQELARQTSIIPFAAALRSGGRPDWLRLAGPALLGLALYGWFLLRGHIWLIGLDPLAGL